MGFPLRMENDKIFIAYTEISFFTWGFVIPDQNSSRPYSLRKPPVSLAIQDPQDIAQKHVKRFCPKEDDQTI